MASGLPRNPGIIGKLLNTIGGKAGANDSGSGPGDRMSRLGLSARSQTLNRKWSWYRTSQYDARKIDWHGREYMDELAVEAVSSRGFIPPGFVDASGQSTPLRFRRPSTPYGLAKVIVDRFTGLLFSEGQHPVIHVDGDPLTEDFVRCIANVSRIWQQMIQARTFGGAMGTAVVGFQFVNGKPVVEVHDPRWCEPQFVERSECVVEQIEKRYQYPKEERNPETGRYETVLYWYRRIINTESDISFVPVPVGNGEEPEWVVAEEHRHNFGFCPVIWVQNLPVQDEVDGDPDCHGTYEMMESIDQLISQAQRGLISNCDPTLVISSDSEMGPQVSKGSGNALQIPKGDAKYLEMTASGPKAAMEMVQELRSLVLEVTQCFLEQGQVQHNRTATEVDRNLAPMLAKADVMREQYGEKCVKPLLKMMLEAATVMSQPTAQPLLDENGQPAQLDENGQPHQEMVRQELDLPPTYVDNGLGQRVAQKRQPGAGGTIELKWPDYFRPSLQDVLTATQAVTTAKMGGVLDLTTAGKFLARYYDVENPAEMVAKAQGEFQQQQQDMIKGSLSTPDSADPAADFMKG